MEPRSQTPRPPGPSRAAEQTGRRPLPRGVVGLSSLDSGPAVGGREGAPSGTLIVGEGIEVKGEIESCRTLVVEGRVQASLEAEALEVRKGGLFDGTAEVDRAEVAGTVEGTLTVRDQLSVATGGRVSGTIRYGRIAIEAGGEISGDVDTQAGAQARARRPSLTGTGS